MSLYKRGGVYWSYIWINNVRHGRSLNTGNKQEAIRREIDFRDELDIRRHKKSNINPEMRFADLATRFLGSGLVKPYHIDRIEQLLPYFGDMPLNEITKSCNSRTVIAQTLRCGSMSWLALYVCGQSCAVPHPPSGIATTRISCDRIKSS